MAQLPTDITVTTQNMRDCITCDIELRGTRRLSVRFFITRILLWLLIRVAPMTVEIWYSKED